MFESESSISEIYDLKLSSQELKLEKGEYPSDFGLWSNDINSKIKKFGRILAQLKDVLREIQQEFKNDEDSAVLMSRKMLYEVEFGKRKFEGRIKRERKLQEVKGPKMPTPAGCTK